MSAKPTEQPRWATDETNNTEPASGLKNTGWSTDEVPTSADINWLLFAIWLWIDYLQDGELEGDHTIDGDLDITGAFSTDDDLDVGGDLAVTGAAVIGGDASVDNLNLETGGTISVNGATERLTVLFGLTTPALFYSTSIIQAYDPQLWWDGGIHTRAVDEIIWIANNAPLEMALTGLRVGDTVTQYSVRVKKNTDATNGITAQIYKITDGARVSVTPTTAFNGANAPGLVIVTSIADPFVVEASSTYVLQVHSSGLIAPAADRLYHCQVHVKRIP